MIQQENKKLQHLAIIMDGNGRWAASQGLSRSCGHVQGAQKLLTLLPLFLKQEIPYVTVFAFSNENWKRPAEETNHLFFLVKTMIQKHQSLFVDNKIGFRWLGQEDSLPDDVIESIRTLEHVTKNFDSLHFNFAFNYSGQMDIFRAIQKVFAQNQYLSEPEEFRKYLSTQNQPDVDMLIRTGGERRISNFLLWQIAYAELYFTQTLWPDITEEEIEEMIKDFSYRKRRFGGLDQHTTALTTGAGLIQSDILTLSEV